MRTLKLILILLMGITLANCSKDNEEPKQITPQNYNDLNRSHIVAKEASMVQTNITTTNDADLVWHVGDVIVYKTSEGKYGKFEILAIAQAENYKLTIKCTTYANDGSVFVSTNSLIVRGTYICDLDAASELSNQSVNEDFFWNRQTNTITYLTPCNNAKFVKYQF